MPELQRREIYRIAYEGATLRENLGLRIPPHRAIRQSEKPARIARIGIGFPL
ncbi:hypothetical protein [Rhizobium lusitanum]|uniref:hypothetical protein n=1 Tax=Rhizobium lusitanum TaxID=293958 RepID=UPI0015745F66|nr:hypothetical protein [Rhizobium lusitanum]NTJ11775.1 hypothetical protein [Rhizobium lusitanum]